MYEKLIACSQILYDIDMVDNVNLVNKYKNKYENPKIKHDSIEQWLGKIDAINNKITELLEVYMNSKPFDIQNGKILWNIIEYISDIVTKELLKFTNTEAWVNTQKSKLKGILNITINSLQSVPIFNETLNNCSKHEILSLFKEIVFDFLDCLWDEISIFKCGHCNGYFKLLEINNSVCVKCSVEQEHKEQN